MASGKPRDGTRRLTTERAGGEVDATERPAVAEAEAELEAWRARAIPDPATPLDADDVARMVRDCFAALHVDPAAAESFSVNTVHFYRRRDVIDAPEGRTSSARYGLRHVWQAAGARLAGYLGLLSLAEARDRIRGADEAALRRFVAARVADARGRQAARQLGARATVRYGEAPRTRAEAPPVVTADVRPLPGVASRAPARQAAPAPRTVPAHATRATIVELGDGAFCAIPDGHPARHSPSVARALVAALAAHLGITNDS